MTSAGASTVGDYDARSGVYAEFGNGTLLDVVRRELPDGGAVLDVGCASGGLLRQLRDQARRQVGLEISERAAAAARGAVDDVVVGDICDPSVEFSGERFDVVVLADVVEHTLEPGLALANARKACKPNGRLVICVPNVAHWWARFHLAAGKWDYQESGLLDQSHVRFFTLRSLLGLIAAEGLVVRDTVPVLPRLENYIAPVRLLPVGMAARIERAWQALGRCRPQLFGYQFIVVAQPDSTSGEDAAAPGSSSTRLPR